MNGKIEINKIGRELDSAFESGLRSKNTTEKHDCGTDQFYTGMLCGLMNVYFNLDLISLECYFDTKIVTPFDDDGVFL